MNISFSETFKKVTSVTLIFGLVFSTLTPAAFAAVISATDSFGSSSDSDIPGWVDGGGDEDADTRTSSGSNLPGALTGAHVRLRHGGHITKTFTTTGHENIKLKYYWKGNSNGDGASDNFVVSWKLTSDSSFSTLNTYRLNSSTSWSSQIISSLPVGANNTSIDIRFQVESNENAEEGYLDDVSIEGDTIVAGDTTPPVITLVGSTPVTVEAGSVYTDAGATALDGVDGDRTANIVTVNSVNSNAVGTYTVTYNVSDVVGNAATQVTRTVNVVDTTAPSVPTNTLPNGTTVNTDGWDFTWNASTDNQPGAITYEYQASQNPTVDGLGVLTTGVWSSGSLATNMIHSAGAAEGVWYWQVRAKDAVGNYSAWSPVATVTKDTIAPVISADGSFLTVGAVTATGAIITYTTVPTATDVGTPSPLVTCSPASGTNFALNSTATITCNSTDNAGNTGVQTFNIIIEDEEDPVLLITGDVYVEAVAPSSATATFSVSATDNVDTFGAPVTSGSAPAIVCSHLSGDTFSFGTTIVTCTATDSEGNDTTDDFNVVVEDTTGPTLIITLDDTDLNVGDTALVTFTFSEAPIGFDNADVSAENGTLDTITGSGTVYTATFTPTTDVEDATNVITVGTDWSDANTPTGNVPTSSTVSTNYTIDTATPIISNVTTEVLYPAGLSIRWTTNEPTTSQVQYGLTTAYGSTSPLDSALVTEHIVDIHGLDSPAEYHFEIITTDPSGNTASTTTEGSGSASTSEGGSGGVTSTGGGLFQTPVAPTPTTPTNTNPQEPTPTPENTPITPAETTTPENPETPVDNNNTPTPNPTESTPTPEPTPTTPVTGGTPGGTPAPAFNPADATLDIGGAGNPEAEPATEEVAPVEGVNDAGGGAVPEENSYTLLWTLLGLIALLNTWWFFVAKNKTPTVHRRD